MRAREGIAYGIAGACAILAGATLAVTATPVPDPAPPVQVIVTVQDPACAEFASQLDAFASDALANADTLASLWEDRVPFQGLGIREDNLDPASERLEYLRSAYGAPCIS
jgi:hypothetical protein